MSQIPVKKVKSFIAGKGMTARMRVAPAVFACSRGIIYALNRLKAFHLVPEIKQHIRFAHLNKEGARSDETGDVVRVEPCVNVWDNL